MQASLKSLVSRVLRQDVSAAEGSRTIGAPQVLPSHLHQFVGGGVDAPKHGWSVEAPKHGWSIEAPKHGWSVEAPKHGW